ncbi:MAG: PIN domain-containing protein [Prosthecobacter sp.]|jgi:tRNA(fMet)-specific endonuclease VapC|uniref:PIN domain-containing protein n=1 Tax=Prosthecobacter sp. TaxID=1965333 RepID=UPI001A0983E1|nr:PIN domain-containing protein [Prosthecobacter sp.]MBE2282572.1 PIN domain-containing protein [Prosthecobacter sp.]
MMYLLDTDTVILMMRGASITAPKSEKQRERRETGLRILGACRRQAMTGDVIALSAITISELEYGACGADDPTAERARMQRVLSPFARFDYKATDAPRQYGVVRSALESKGRSIGPNDLLIAAHALALSAVLVTNNTKEFRRVRGLACENWAV